MFACLNNKTCKHASLTPLFFEIAGQLSGLSATEAERLFTVYYYNKMEQFYNKAVEKVCADIKLHQLFNAAGVPQLTLAPDMPQTLEQKNQALRTISLRYQVRLNPFVIWQDQNPQPVKPSFRKRYLPW